MSALVPAVVGIQINGNPGILTASIPSNSLTGTLFVNVMLIAFAQSIGLPPPSATTISHFSRLRISAPFITSVSFGFGVTSSNKT